MPQQEKANWAIVAMLIAITLVGIGVLWAVITGPEKKSTPCSEVRFQAGQRVYIAETQKLGRVRSWECDEREGVNYYQVDIGTEILRYPEGLLSSSKEVSK